MHGKLFLQVSPNFPFNDAHDRHPDLRPEKASVSKKNKACTKATKTQHQAVGDGGQNIVLRGNIYVISDSGSLQTRQILSYT